MVIDIDAKRRLIRASQFLGVMLGVTLAGIIWDGIALFALTFNATAWVLWLTHKVSAVRELAYDTDTLSLSTKEDHTMKK